MVLIFFNLPSIFGRNLSLKNLSKKMKKIKIILILILASCICTASSNIYNPLSEITQNFKIISIYKKPLYNSQNFVMMRAIDPKTNKIFTLEIAPDWYLDKTQFSNIKVFDKVVMIGSIVASKNNWIMIREINKGGLPAIEIRTQTGFPLWRADQ